VCEDGGREASHTVLLHATDGSDSQSAGKDTAPQRERESERDGESASTESSARWGKDREHTRTAQGQHEHTPPASPVLCVCPGPDRRRTQQNGRNAAQQQSRSLSRISLTNDAGADERTHIATRTCSPKAALDQPTQCRFFTGSFSPVCTWQLPPVPFSFACPSEARTP
jgi:hypothetical protein